MKFNIRSAKAQDAKSIGNLVAGFAEYLCALGSAISFYERLGARFTQDMLFMRLDV